MRDLPQLASLRMADVLELHLSVLCDLRQLHSLQARAHGKHVILLLWVKVRHAPGSTAVPLESGCATEHETQQGMVSHVCAMRQELVLDFSYTAVWDPVNTYTPEDPDDVTRLLGMLPALRALRCVQIVALRRRLRLPSIGAYAELEHLALACRELHVEYCGIHAVAPRSLHVILEQAAPAVVRACGAHAAPWHHLCCMAGLASSRMVEPALLSGAGSTTGIGWGAGRDPGDAGGGTQHGGHRRALHVQGVAVLEAGAAT